MLATKGIHVTNRTLTTVTTHIVVDKSTDNAKPHSICFSLQYRRQIKCIFLERDQDRDTKKE